MLILSCLAVLNLFNAWLAFAAGLRDSVKPSVTADGVIVYSTLSNKQIKISGLNHQLNPN